METTKTCKVCERELPLTAFRTVRNGHHVDTCNDCCAAKLRQTKARNRIQATGGGKYSDSELDGKDPNEVIQRMVRCRRWLEAQGYTIDIQCHYEQRKIIRINCK